MAILKENVGFSESKQQEIIAWLQNSAKRLFLKAMVSSRDHWNRVQALAKQLSQRAGVELLQRLGEAKHRAQNQKCRIQAVCALHIYARLRDNLVKRAVNNDCWGPKLDTVESYLILRKKQGMLGQLKAFHLHTNTIKELISRVHSYKEKKSMELSLRNMAENLRKSQTQLSIKTAVLTLKPKK